MNFLHQYKIIDYLIIPHVWIDFAFLVKFKT